MLVVVAFLVLADLTQSPVNTYYGHFVRAHAPLGGNWEVTISVKNQGAETAAPDCAVTAIGEDGTHLASDSAQLSPIKAGDTLQVTLQTGLTVGDVQVSTWQVSCT
jgi:hypothetical protein